MISALLKNVTVRNALMLYVIQFSSYVMPLITLPYLSRTLTPEKFGLVAYAQSIMWYFVTLTEYGFNLSATRQVAVNRDNPEEISRIFSSVMVAKALLTALGFMILLVTVLAVPRLRADLNLFLLAFLSVVGSFLFPQWLFQGLQKMEQAAIRDFIAKLLGIGLLFLLVHNDSDYAVAAGVQGGSVAVAGLIGLLCVPLVVNVRWQRPTWNDVKERLVGGWPLFLSLAASSFAGVTNIVIVGLIASPAEVGYFSGAHRLVSVLRGMVNPVVNAVYPMLSAKAGKDEREVVRFIQRYSVMLSAPFLAVGLLLMVAGPFVIRLVLGSKYDASIGVMQIMALSPFLLAAQHIFSTYYMLACGYDKAWMRIMLTNVAMNFVILIPLLFTFRGSIALAVTQVATDLIAVALYWRFYRQTALRDPGPTPA